MAISAFPRDFGHRMKVSENDFKGLNFKPMIQKTDLRIGNMFEQGIVFKISGRAGAKVHLHGKGKWYKGFRTEVSVSELKPIVLTPEILTEWCGFRDMDGGIFVNHAMSLVWDGKQVYSAVCGKFSYLHELQNLNKVVSGKELEIKE